MTTNRRRVYRGRLYYDHLINSLNVCCLTGVIIIVLCDSDVIMVRTVLVLVQLLLWLLLLLLLRLLLLLQLLVSRIIQ